MGASEDINPRLGREGGYAAPLSLHSAPLSQESFIVLQIFKGPQMLTDWHVLLFIPVILPHLEQSV